MSRAIEILLADQANTKRDWKTDWKETSKLDFGLEEPLEDQTVVTSLDTSVNSAAQHTPGFMWFGSGNTSNHFLVVRNSTQGLELATKVYERAGPGYSVASAAGPDGYHTFEVPTDPLVVLSNGDTRVKWNMAFSIVTGLDGVQSSMTDFEFDLKMDFDPVNMASDPSSIHLSYGGNGIWRSMLDGRIIISSDSQMYVKGANYSKIEQNAFNIAAKSLDTLRPSALSSTWSQEEGFFTLMLTAKLGGKQVAAIKQRVHTKSDFSWL
jgi:hypothetical protein